MLDAAGTRVDLNVSKTFSLMMSSPEEDDSVSVHPTSFARRLSSRRVLLPPAADVDGGVSANVV